MSKNVEALTGLVRGVGQLMRAVVAVLPLVVMLVVIPHWFFGRILLSGADHVLTFLMRILGM